MAAAEDLGYRGYGGLLADPTQRHDAAPLLDSGELDEFVGVVNRLGDTLEGSAVPEVEALRCSVRRNCTRFSDRSWPSE